jgi:hypothetical protein
VFVQARPYDEPHFVCGLSPGDGCLSKHVHTRGLALRELDDRGLAALEAEALAAGDERRARELGGAVHCPAPGCGGVVLRANKTRPFVVVTSCMNVS